MFFKKRFIDTHRRVEKFIDKKRYCRTEKSKGRPIKNSLPDKKVGTMKEILIQRVGNLILRGEGLGVHVIDHLPTDTLLPTIKLLNSSTENLVFTDSLQKYRCSVLIDTSLDRKRSGTIRYLNPRHTHNFPSPRSIHELCLKKDDRSQKPHRYTVPTSSSSPYRRQMSKKPGYS